MNGPRDQVFPVHKLDYVSGHRPPVPCILCSVVGRDPRVVDLEILRTDLFLVSANLYPYNTGHLMIFPLRHIVDVAEYTDEEVMELHRLHLRSLEVLRNLYHPAGFNLGYNLGRVGGASIDHLHFHIVPRFPNEAGFLDVLTGTRIIVEEPAVTVRRVRQAWEQRASNTKSRRETKKRQKGVSNGDSGS